MTAPESPRDGARRVGMSGFDHRFDVPVKPSPQAHRTSRQGRHPTVWSLRWDYLGHPGRKAPWSEGSLSRSPAGKLWHPSSAHGDSQRRWLTMHLAQSCLPHLEHGARRRCRCSMGGRVLWDRGSPALRP